MSARIELEYTWRSPTHDKSNANDSADAVTGALECHHKSMAGDDKKPYAFSNARRRNDVNGGKKLTRAAGRRSYGCCLLFQLCCRRNNGALAYCSALFDLVWRFGRRNVIQMTSRSPLNIAIVRRAARHMGPGLCYCISRNSFSVSDWMLKNHPSVITLFTFDAEQTFTTQLNSFVCALFQLPRFNGIRKRMPSWNKWPKKIMSCNWLTATS